MPGNNGDMHLADGDIPVLPTKRPLDLMITDIACQDFKMARLKKGTADAGIMGFPLDQ